MRKQSASCTRPLTRPRAECQHSGPGAKGKQTARATRQGHPNGTPCRRFDDCGATGSRANGATVGGETRSQV